MFDKLQKKTKPQVYNKLFKYLEINSVPLVLLRLSTTFMCVEPTLFP